MKKLITMLLAFAIVGITLDQYTIDATLVGVTNEDVLYEDIRGHIWAIERDKDATYRLDQNVTLVMRQNFNRIIEDDIIVGVNDK